MEWRLTQNETRSLINLYREKECLWNFQSSLYKRNDLKRKAWDNMALELNKDVMEIKKKIKNLRSAYVAEKKKIEESKRSGSSSESVYDSNLFYFHDFSFLDDVIVLRKTHSNMTLDDTLERAVEATELQEEAMALVEDFNVPSPSSTSSQMRGSARRSAGRRIAASSSSRSARYEDAIAAILQQSNTPPEPRSKYAIFGNSVASQLEELSPIEAAAAMADLQQVLSRHVVQSLQQRQATSSMSSSLSSSLEGNDILRNAMLNSELFEEF